jgi:hypothetical protein
MARLNCLGLEGCGPTMATETEISEIDSVGNG